MLVGEFRVVSRPGLRRTRPLHMASSIINIFAALMPDISFRALTNTDAHPVCVQAGLLSKVDYVELDLAPREGTVVLVLYGKVEPLVVAACISIDSHVEVVFVGDGGYGFSSWVWLLDSAVI